MGGATGRFNITLVLSDNLTALHSRASFGDRAGRPLGAGALEVVPVASLGQLARPGSLVDEAFRSLLMQIEMGLWPSGARLPSEQQLAHALGVSRAVVREALARLKADGRIETRRGAGAFVAEPHRLSAFRTDHPAEPAAGLASPASLRVQIEVLELRQIVESGAARLAARRRRAADLKAIDAALAVMESALAEGADGSAADDAFHTAIARAAGNTQIARFVEFLGARFSLSRRQTWDPDGRSAGLAAIGQDDHRAIRDAIRRRDAEAAGRLAAEHVGRAIDRARRSQPERLRAGNAGSAPAPSSQAPDERGLVQAKSRSTLARRGAWR